MPTEEDLTGTGRAGRLAVWLLVATAAVGVAIVSFAGTEAANLDDTFIVLVYARHLLESGALFWNRVDGPVEGFTSILDVLVKAGSLLLFRSDPLKGSWWVTLATLSAVPLLWLGLFSRLARSWPAWRRIAFAALATFLVASGPCLADGSSYLLETPLFVLLATASAGALLHDEPSRPVSLGVAALLVGTFLSRPEGLPLALAILAFSLVEGGARKWRESRWPTATVVAAVGVAVTFRRVVFGEWAPNTYFAKTSDSRWNELRDGWAYLMEFRRASLLGDALVALALLAPFLVLVRGWRGPWLRRRFAFLSLAALGSLVLVVAAGGDCYRGGRFLALPLSLSAMALLAAVAWLEGTPRTVVATVLAVLLLAQMREMGRTLGSGLQALGRAPLRTEAFDCDRQIGAALSGLLPRGSTVAQSDYQKLKLFADDLRVVDLQGLNHRRFAHLPWPGRCLFGKYRHANGVEIAAPIWIYGYRTELHPEPMARFSLHAVLTDPAVYGPHVGYPAEGADAEAIRRLYLPASLPVCGRYFDFLVRRDVAASLEARGVLVGQE